MRTRLGTGKAIGLAGVLLGATPGWGGVSDTPTPTLNGHSSQTVAILPTVVKHNNVETDVICTNIGGSTIDLGFEIFGADGTRGNSVNLGNGVITGVTPGRTVTIGTGGTAVLHEDALVTIEPASGLADLANGSGRVVANPGATVRCVAFAADLFHHVVDPASSSERTPGILNVDVTTVASGGGATTTTTSTVATTTTTSTSLPPPVCPATPTSGCRTPVAVQKAKLKIKNPIDPTKRQFQWKWIAGVATSVSDFGDPLGGTAYAICIYDAGSLVRTYTIPAGGTCGTKPCWSANPKGFKWKTTAVGNLQQLILKAGPDGFSQIQAKGKGSGVNPPGLPMALPALVQIKHNSSSTCWEASFGFPVKNQIDLFSSKAD